MHVVSTLIGLSALVIGARWVQAGGEAVAVPPTLIVLALVVLTPLAIDRSWTSRGEFVDRHMQAGRRFLTTLGLTAAVVIGLPASVTWLLPVGSELWSSLMVVPYLGALAIPVGWAFFAARAAILAMRGAGEPFPRWMVTANGS